MFTGAGARIAHRKGAAFVVIAVLGALTLVFSSTYTASAAPTTVKCSAYDMDDSGDEKQDTDSDEKSDDKDSGDDSDESGSNSDSDGDSGANSNSDDGNERKTASAKRTSTSRNTSTTSARRNTSTNPLNNPTTAARMAKDSAGCVINKMRGGVYKKTDGKQNMSIVNIAYNIAKQRKADDKVMLALFETGLAESNFKNYANSKVGDSKDITHDAMGNNGKSVGYMQQQVGFNWGPEGLDGEDEVRALMDPNWATVSFLTRAMKKAEDHDGDAASLAQSIQRSSFDDGSNYREKEGEAKELIEKAKDNVGKQKNTKKSPLTTDKSGTTNTGSRSTTRSRRR